MSKRQVEKEKEQKAKKIKNKICGQSRFKWNIFRNEKEK